MTNKSWSKARRRYYEQRRVWRIYAGGDWRDEVPFLNGFKYEHESLNRRWPPRAGILPAVWKHVKQTTAGAGRSHDSARRMIIAQLKDNYSYS